MDQLAVWVVRGGNNNELASQVKSRHAVAIGWRSVGDVSNTSSRDELRAAMEASEPGSGTPGAVGQLYRFAREINPGDYQVCEKWLKDRKGRVLSAEDIAHYQNIVVALHETICIMGEIDAVIEKHGGWPGAFNVQGGDG
jgi:hypothetical protein